MAHILRRQRVTSTHGQCRSDTQTWVIGDEDKVFNDMCEFIDAYGITDVVTAGCPPDLIPSR